MGGWRQKKEYSHKQQDFLEQLLVLRPVTSSVFLFFSLENDPVPSFSRKLEKKADRQQPFCTDPRVLVNNRIDMIQHHALAEMKASSILVWNRKIATKSSEVIFPFTQQSLNNSWNTASGFAPPSARKMLIHLSDSSGDHRDTQEAAALGLWGEAEGGGLAQPG